MLARLTARARIGSCRRLTRLPFAADVTTTEDLPPDQRAALDLLLLRGQSYEEISAVLDISVPAVRARALAACEALAPGEAAALELQRLGEVVDLVLGQVRPPDAASLRAEIAIAPPERAFATALGTALRSIGGAALPSFAADDGAAEGPPTSAAPPPSSRRGGAILLGLLALVIAGGAAAFLLLRGEDEPPSRKATTTARTGADASAPRVVGQVTLRAVRQGNPARGVGQFLRQGGNQALALVGIGLSRRRAGYSLWLYDSPEKTVWLGNTQPVARSGRLSAIAPLPSGGFTGYRELLLTRERAGQPRRPTTIVLRGRIRRSSG